MGVTYGEGGGVAAGQAALARRGGSGNSVCVPLGLGRGFFFLFLINLMGCLYDDRGHILFAHPYVLGFWHRVGAQ